MNKKATTVTTTTTSTTTTKASIPTTVAVSTASQPTTSTASTTTTTRPPQTIYNSTICTGPEQYYPYQYDCSKFIKCGLIEETNQVIEVVEQCPAGLLFNAAIKVCDWSSNVYCNVVSTTTIPTKPSKPNS